MTVLVTGGAGFIGSHLIEKLASQKSKQIVAVDNFNDYYDPALKRENANRLSAFDNVTLIEGDFRKEATCNAIFKDHQIENVIHLGAFAGVRISVERPLVYEETNVRGTLALLEAARTYGPLKRFLLISSSTVYGRGAEIPFNEDKPLGVPASPYGATKRSAELMGLTYHQLHDVPVVCLRPFSVYGPRLRPDLALSIFCDAILSRRKLPLFGDGTISRDFTHVSDICDGLVAALDAINVEGETINLGHSEPVEMRRIIALLEEGLNVKADVEHLPARAEDLTITFADLAKAKLLLNYKPKVGIADGIKEFCDWYKNWHSS